MLYKSSPVTHSQLIHSKYDGSCLIPTSFSSKAREVGNEPRSLLRVLNICWPYFIHQTWLLIESHSKHNVTCEETRHQEMADSLQKWKKIAICDLQILSTLWCIAWSFHVTIIWGNSWYLVRKSNHVCGQLYSTKLSFVIRVRTALTDPKCWP